MNGVGLAAMLGLFLQLRQSPLCCLSHEVRFSGASSSSASHSANALQVTLQAFLSTLQDGLGYGSTNSNASASGNIVSSAARASAK